MKIGSQLKNSLLLGIAAVVWGISFVIQQIGGQALGAYTFNSFRFLLGALFVWLSTFFMDRINSSYKPKTKAEWRKMIKVGIAAGVFLTIASDLQQVALNMGVMPGKAGFLTAVYILLVPILGLILKKKCGINVWIAVVIALAGLYFLCINGAFVLQKSDILLLLCALGFSIQILIIDKFACEMDGLRFSVVEFIVAGVITFVLALIFEIIPYEGGFNMWVTQFASKEVWFSLAYMSIGSCGLGYTLQVIGQQNLNPTIASLIMSLESVFSVIASVVFLGSAISTRELIGCILMFLAICLAQINFKNSKKSD